MAEPIEELRKEIQQIRGVLVERERRMNRIEKSMAAIDAEEITKQIREVNEVLVGTTGNSGLKRSVERLLIIVDGDEKYGVTGIVDQISDLKEEVQKLTAQRDQIKWVLFGMLLVTTLGNASGIITLFKTFFGL